LAALYSAEINEESKTRILALQ